MARKLSKPATPAIDRTHISEDPERAGDLVRIIGDAGTVLAGIFRVRCHVTNTLTQSQWVELNEVGGSKEFRAVRPERTRPATKAELRSRSITQETR